ncbi:YbjN domain-containing protein [Pedobacter sp. BS3]|uniref:YbjN domain-containing protein n=1 Tax=Pedobacter sp. BS3 TaxID=2567937 RepID=UPI001F5BC8DC|nr:YbjN domain-containing protein [Pedobacter sp. BS3]
MAGTNGSFQCFADLNEDESQFIFSSICGANTPAEKKRKMLELLNAINYKLFFGNFEMNWEDGEIRFRTSISYKNLNININFIEELIMTNIITMDKSLPSIMERMFGDISIEKAIEHATKEE